jgi:SAM-dependent methyltransferase
MSDLAKMEKMELPELAPPVEDELALLAASVAAHPAFPEPGIDPRYSRFSAERQAYWDRASASTRGIRIFRSHYQKRLRELYGQLIPPGKRVLEIGCGSGDLLAWLQPSYGVGVDFSAAMLDAARRKHPEQTFIQADAHEFNLGETFDYIVCADLVNDLWDVQTFFRTAAGHAHSSTRFILNAYSRVWEMPRRLAETAGLARPLPPQSWLTVQDIANLLWLAISKRYAITRRSCAPSAYPGWMRCSINSWRKFGHFAFLR